MKGTLAGRALVAGEAQGEVLRLHAPLSFWGGVDPATGVITQPRHPEHRRCVHDRVLAMPGTVGSSSSSAVLLELIHAGRAPRAIVLARADAILALGSIVARELGHAAIPIVEAPVDDLETGDRVRIEVDGTIVSA